jgi:hypothetical protein
MRPVVMRALAIAFLLFTPAAARAQWVVYDPTNYAQAVTRYLQAVQQYEFLVRQAARLPSGAANRYRVPEHPWQVYQGDLSVLAALNGGASAASAYRGAVDPLDSIADVLAKVPAAVRARLNARYAALGVSDGVAQMSLQQAGAGRAAGPTVLRAIQAMEDDALSGPDEYHSQTALLNKINGASVLGLRIAEHGNQLMVHTVEQLLLDNVRKRQAEAELMNAHVYQWRYGVRYGAEMFDKTAHRLDSWRQP